MSKSLSARENIGIVDSNSGSRRTTCEEIEYALHHPRRVRLAGMDPRRHGDDGTPSNLGLRCREVSDPEHLALVASESQRELVRVRCAVRLGDKRTFSP